MTTQAAPLRVPVRRAKRQFHVVIGPGMRRGRAIYWILLGIVVAAAFLGSVYARIALDRAAFDLVDIEGRIGVEEARYWDLRLEVSELQAPARVAAAAEKLGMVYPGAVDEVMVPGIGGPGPETDERWIDLKGLLSALP